MPPKSKQSPAPKANSAAPRRARKPRNTKKRLGSSTTYSAPVAIGRTIRSNAASVSNVGSKGSIVVRHREYFQDLTLAVAFNGLGPINQPVNPGNTILFPWLSHIARNYESYRFRHLEVCYEPSCSTSTAGKVLMAFDYDCSDNPPMSKQVMMAFRGAVSAVPWQEATLMLNKTDSGTLGERRFVKAGTLQTATDRKTYDVAQLYIFSAGATTETVVGEIYVEYEVEFITPQMDSEPESAKITSGGVVSPGNIWGSIPNVLGPVITSVANNRFDFAEIGQYLFDTRLTGTGIGTLIASPGGGCVSTLEEALVNTGSTQGSFLHSVNVTELPSWITFNNDASAVSGATTRISDYLYSFS